MFVDVTGLDPLFVLPLLGTVILLFLQHVKREMTQEISYEGKRLEFMWFILTVIFTFTMDM